MAKQTFTFDPAALFGVIRQLAVNGKLNSAEVASINKVLQGEDLTPIVQKGISEADFKQSSLLLKCSVAQIKAVWEVESTGQGYIDDPRADILALDGPGGFIDGPALPKILFEALWFHKLTEGKYDKSHPNISSKVWDRSLYVGGQGEWIRLWKAMQLDEEAALKSASWGAPQIMGFNYHKCGFKTVVDFANAMKRSETAQLEAFSALILNFGWADELRAISKNPETCRSFAKCYNGAQYAVNQYHVKLAKAFDKWD